MRSRLQGRTHHPLRPGLRRGESAGDSRRRQARSGHRATSEDEPTWNIQGPRCREATVCSVRQDLLQPRAVTSPTRWRDAVHPRRSARQASGGRSRPRAHRPQRVPRHALGPGTERLVRRGGTIFADAATTTPPARAHGRGDARRRSWSSSRLRPPHRWARSPPSRCLPGLARAVSAAAASPPPGEGRACAAPRPRTGRLFHYDERAKASGERRGPARRR
jgi:hypothetical protein